MVASKIYNFIYIYNSKAWKRSTASHDKIEEG